MARQVLWLILNHLMPFSLYPPSPSSPSLPIILCHKFLSLHGISPRCASLISHPNSTCDLACSCPAVEGSKGIALALAKFQENIQGEWICVHVHIEKMERSGEALLQAKSSLPHGIRYMNLNARTSND